MNSRTTLPFMLSISVDLVIWLSRASLDVKKYGDGGVDVTGVPNCRLAEGAMKRRGFTTFLGKLNLACWGLHILSQIRTIKLRGRDVNSVLSVKKLISSVTFLKLTRQKGEIGRNTDDNFNTNGNCFLINITLPNYFLPVSFTNLLSSLIDDFLNLVSQWKGVFNTSSPQRLVPFRHDLSRVGLADQPTENNVDRAVVLFLHPLCGVFGNNKNPDFNSFTDTWQSICANMLKSRKDTPRYFLNNAQSAAFFMEHRLPACETLEYKYLACCEKKRIFNGVYALNNPQARCLCSEYHRQGCLCSE